MYSLMISCGYILDLIFGDPQWLPHPVRGIGWMIKKLEPVLRKTIKNERVSGILFAFLVIGIVWAISFIIIKLCYFINIYLGTLISILLIYTSLSIKDLKVESIRVYDALIKGDIVLARKNLSLIVGRDTENLNEKEIIRATVETIAENIVDAIISPLFYVFIGGPCLAIMYKAINTLDSMVGYKNEVYRDFGFASAKIDDISNFIPARLSALFLPLAVLIAGGNSKNSFRIGWRDGKKNPSPNSGIPEAALSGALGVQLGGINFYNSIPIEKPFIGDDINPLKVTHIKESIKIAYICSFLFLITGIICFELWTNSP
ncbi:MAG: adenosylcobinamide-phosphate synthase CbiB [Candidatus Hydrogenedentota bacterium]